MTRAELKNLICELIDEAVPIDLSTDIAHGLRTKYGRYELEEYTFGVEFEYLPLVHELDPRSATDREVIETKLSSLFGSRNDMGLSDDYDTWLSSNRQSAAEYWSRRAHTIGDLSKYDEDYDPIDLDTFDSVFPEPERSDFGSDESFEESHEEWEEARNDVDSEFSRWQRRDYNDYIDEFLKDLMHNDGWRSYFSEDEQYQLDPQVSIREAIDFLTTELGQDAEEGDKADKNTWAVGEDGSNVEIRSRIMRQTPDDYAVIRDVADWVYEQKTASDTGLHVHIGVPRDFDAFDLLAMTTLVDEEAIQNEVGSDRNLGSYAKLRRSLSNSLLNFITPAISPDETETEIKPVHFTLNNQQVLDLIRNVDRNHGTNIKAFFEHKTIEFRYLGSENANRLLKWLDYFLLLPRIAKSRNKILLKSIYGEKMYAIRRPNGSIEFILEKSPISKKRTKMTLPTLPADVMKSDTALKNLGKKT